MYDHSPDAETATSLAAADPTDRPDRPAPPVHAPPVHAPAVRATDGERLMRFRMHRDEAAFREVVEAHAVLVWGVCWQVLRHREDVEDVFQATFLILARKGAAIRATDSAAGWLYRVAFRTALAARARRRRLAAEPLAAEPPASLEEQFASIERAEQVEALLEELHALGDRYRQPLVLCYLEGRSRQEAADELGVTLQSVKGRLARGMRMLRTRLAYRGMALSSAVAVMTSEMAAAEATLATAPVAQTVGAATSFAWAAFSTKAAATKTAGTKTVAQVAATQKTISITPGAALLAKQGLLAMKYAAIVKPVLTMCAVAVAGGAIALAAGDSSSGDASSSDKAAGAERGSTTVVELTDGAGEGANTFVAITDDKDAASDGQYDFEGDATINGAGETETNGTGGAPADDSAQAAGELGHIEIRSTPGEEESQGRVTLTSDAGTLTAESLTINTLGPTLSVQDGTLTLQNDDDSAQRDEERLKVDYEADPNQPGVLRVRARDHLAPVNAAAGFPLSGSVKVMKLERDHWQLKARGLQYKVDALKMKVQEMGNVSGAALAELEAEAHLATAEIKLCEARAQQLTEAIEQGPATIELRAPVPANPGIAVPATPVGAAPAPPLDAMLAAPAAQPTPPMSANLPVPAPSTASHLPVAGVATGWNGPANATAPRPLGIHLLESPTPERVGSRVVWDFLVANQSSTSDENVELRIPIPDFLVVDPSGIVSPYQVHASIEGNEVIFTPLPRSLQPGESLRYRVPFTLRKPGSAVLRGIAMSKNVPKGVWIGAGIAVAENSEQQSTVATSTWQGNATPVGVAAASSGSWSPPLAATDERTELRKLVKNLTKANEELERRLGELERRKEAPIK
jgi:RNA polymerase sigma factor (sigma-70 family)